MAGEGDSAACAHTEFTANVAVNRISDIGRYVADVTIRCVGCGTPMVFLGLPRGLDYEGPRCSFDGTEARLGIAPLGEAVPPVNGVRGFDIRQDRGERLSPN